MSDITKEWLNECARKTMTCIYMLEWYEVNLDSRSIPFAQDAVLRECRGLWML